VLTICSQKQLSLAFHEKAYTPVANQRNGERSARAYTLDDGTKFGKEDEQELR